VRRPAPPRHNDAGSVLVLVMVMSVLLMGVLVATLSASDFAGTISTQYGNTSQASLAAQSGLAVELSAMRTASGYTALPCGSFSGSLSAPGAISSYSGTITYYPSGSNPTALTCSGSTLGGSTAPASATILSTGTDTHGSPTSMEETVNIAVPQVTNPAAALGYALFTTNALDLESAATLENSGSNIANVYSGGTLTCASSTSVPGTLTTHASISLSGGPCTTGGLISTGAITSTGAFDVNGNMTAYGGSVTLGSTTTVTGNVTATDGNISLSSAATIDGNAAASGTISVTGAAKIKGTQTPNDSALSADTPPAAVPFPSECQSGYPAPCSLADSNITDADWQAGGWTVVDIPNSTYTCASFFQNVPAGSGPFQNEISSETSKTVYDALGCSATTPCPPASGTSCYPSYSGAETFKFAQDTVLEVPAISVSSADTFESTSSTMHNFSILASPLSVCSTSGTDITMTSAVTLASSLAVFLYTPGEVSFSSASSSSAGQIVACGGITGTSAFTFTYNPSAGAEVLGLSTTVPSSTTAPTISATEKFVT
jgi:hypothetical protein